MLLGTAALLAESLKGINHTLHSRSAGLLQLLFDQHTLERSALVLSGGGGAAQHGIAQRGVARHGAAQRGVVDHAQTSTNTAMEIDDKHTRQSTRKRRRSTGDDDGGDDNAAAADGDADGDADAQPPPPSAATSARRQTRATQQQSKVQQQPQQQKQPQPQQQKQQQRVLTPQQLEVAHGRVRAVAVVTLDRVWQHLRRGACGPVWEVLLHTAEHALDVMLDTAQRERGGDDDTQQHQQQQQDEYACEYATEVARMRRRLACELMLVCQGVEFHRGGRVESYTPLFALIRRVLEHHVVVAAGVCMGRRSDWWLRGGGRGDVCMFGSICVCGCVCICSFVWHTARSSSIYLYPPLIIIPLLTPPHSLSHTHNVSLCIHSHTHIHIYMFICTHTPHRHA